MLQVYKTMCGGKTAVQETANWVVHYWTMFYVDTVLTIIVWVNKTNFWESPSTGGVGRTLSKSVAGIDVSAAIRDSLEKIPPAADRGVPSQIRNYYPKIFRGFPFPLRNLLSREFPKPAGKIRSRTRKSFSIADGLMVQRVVTWTFKNTHFCNSENP